MGQEGIREHWDGTGRSPPGGILGRSRSIDVHPSDPRQAAARLADRMAAEGYPWDAIRKMSPYEMLLILGMSSVGKLESRLDIVHLLVTLGKEVKRIQDNRSRGQNIHADDAEKGGGELREREPAENPLEGETRTTRKTKTEEIRDQITLGVLPTLTFDPLRDPEQERRERKIMTQGDLEDLTNPARRMLIATRPYTAFHLNELALRVCSGCTGTQIAEGLTKGAVEAAKRVYDATSAYGLENTKVEIAVQEIKRRGGQIRERDDYKARGYHVYGRDKDLELAKALLGEHLRDKGEYPTHAEDRLYRFLQIKEEELTEAGLLTVMPDDPQKVRKEREKGNIIASGPRTIFSKLKEKRKAHWLAIKEVYAAGDDWAEHWAARYSGDPTVWHDWKALADEIGADHFNPRDYIAHVNDAAARAMAAQMQRTDEAKPLASKFMYEAARTLEYPNHKLVRALMQSSLRVCLADEATLLSAAGLPSGWVPEIKTNIVFAPTLEIACANLKVVVEHLNRMPMIHPHMPLAFASLCNIRDYFQAVLLACQQYGFGSKELDEIRCGEALKEPMYPEMGERPEFMPRTSEEVMRTYASGLAVVGNERQKDALRFPNFPTEEMKKAIQEEGNVPAVELKVQMPVEGYRVLQSVTTGDEFPLTFLRVRVGKTTPIMATREAISLLGTSGLKDPTTPPVPLVRGLTRDREEGGLHGEETPRGQALEEGRGPGRFLQEGKNARPAGVGIRDDGSIQDSRYHQSVRCQ